MTPPVWLLLLCFLCAAFGIFIIVRPQSGRRYPWNRRRGIYWRPSRGGRSRTLHRPWITRFWRRGTVERDAQYPDLPEGRVIYSDADGGAHALIARRYPLTGKPDYVVETPHDGLVPVEFKSAHLRGTTPRPGDVLQLATYLVILEDVYRRTPRYGVLSYSNRRVDIPYTPSLKESVLSIVAELERNDAVRDRLNRRRSAAPRGTPSVGTCRGCHFKSICEDAVPGL